MYPHTKTLLAAISLDKVGALDDLQQNLYDNIVGSLRTISQRRGVLRHLAALVHFPHQLLYERVAVCLQLDHLTCGMSLRLHYYCLALYAYFICNGYNSPRKFNKWMDLLER